MFSVVLTGIVSYKTLGVTLHKRLELLSATCAGSESLETSSAAHLAGHVEAKTSCYDGGCDLSPQGWGEQKGWPSSRLLTSTQLLISTSPSLQEIYCSYSSIKTSLYSPGHLLKPCWM